MVIGQSPELESKGELGELTEQVRQKNAYISKFEDCEKKRLCKISNDKDEKGIHIETI